MTLAAIALVRGRDISLTYCYDVICYGGSNFKACDVESVVESENRFPEKRVGQKLQLGNTISQSLKARLRILHPLLWSTVALRQ